MLVNTFFVDNMKFALRFVCFRSDFIAENGKEIGSNCTARNRNAINDNISNRSCKRRKNHQGRCNHEAHNAMGTNGMILLKYELHHTREQQKRCQHSDAQRNQHTEIQAGDARRHCFVNAEE